MPDSQPPGDELRADQPDRPEETQPSERTVEPDPPPETAAVSEALAPLAGRPVEEHAATFEQVHERLRDRLRDVEPG